MRKIRWFTGIVIIIIMLIGAACARGPDETSAEATPLLPSVDPGAESPGEVPPADIPPETLAQPDTQALPPSTPSLTPLPSPTNLSEEYTAASPSPQLGLPTPAPPGTPPLSGSFDVYLGAPDGNGYQLLRWVETTTSEKATEVAIQTDDGKAVRAGQYVYYHAQWTRQPRRANTAGAVETLTFSEPPSGASYFQLLPNATGDYLAWLSVSGDGTSYTIHQSSSDGRTAGAVAQGALDPGMTIRLLRLTNDGSTVFYDLRPASATGATVFNQRYDLYALNVATGTSTRLPGEPACGEGRGCDAHISLDGAYLVRALPTVPGGVPIVVTNLANGSVVGRFEPQGVPAGAAFEVGYPFFTPGGELIYVISYGPPELENYLLVWANLVTGEQRVVAELGIDRHRPLGWTGGGTWLLTTREPAVYDTWQINIETGEARQIAGMLFLGHIEVP
jgi:hypothetical protein